jgi:hypothetical protein
LLSPATRPDLPNLARRAFDATPSHPHGFPAATMSAQDAPCGPLLKGWPVLRPAAKIAQSPRSVFDLSALGFDMRKLARNNERSARRNCNGGTMGSAFFERVLQKGYTERDALRLAADVRAWGQLAFAATPMAKAQAELTRRARRALLASVEGGASPEAIRARIFHEVTSPVNAGGSDPAPDGKGALSQICDPFFASRYMRGESNDERVASCQLGARGIYEAMGPMAGEALIKPLDPLGSLDPERVEHALHGRASAIMERFGLASVRLGGLPGFDEASRALNRLERSLSVLAQRAGIGERAIGLEGYAIHLGCEMDVGSAFCDSGYKLIACAPGGWAGLAHEWFHAFDYAAGSAARLSGAKKDYGALSYWEGGVDDCGMAPSALRLKTAAAHLQSSLWRSATGAAELERIRREPPERAARRLSEGLGESFYFPVLPLGSCGAREAFTSLCSSLLRGEATAADASAWRDKFLGRAGERLAHYDQLLMAEASMRAKAVEVAAPGNSSLFAAFAREADARIQASGIQGLSGYACSKLEMSARGFEGHCFEGLSADDAAWLVHAVDGSMYWPVGQERGACAGAYRDVLRSGVALMEEVGLIAPGAAAPTPNIAAQLASRRAAAKKPSPAPFRF